MNHNKFNIFDNKLYETYYKKTDKVEAYKYLNTELKKLAVKTLNDINQYKTKKDYKVQSCFA